MQINRAQIVRSLIGIAEPKISQIDEYVASFNMWAVHFGVTDPKRVAAYLAQTFHESACLAATEENLNYSAEGLLKTFPRYFKTRSAAEGYARTPQKIANRVYANRMGNGNEASGDGWRYRGRGYIQLTGKTNYQLFMRGDWCEKDVVKNPDLVAGFYYNQLASLWFWESRGLNHMADLDNMEAITRKINGGTNGQANRMLLYRRFCREFGVKKTIAYGV